VFAPLSLPVLEAAYSTRKWRTLAPVSVLSAFQQQRTSADQQVVILVQVRGGLCVGGSTGVCRYINT